LLNEDDAPRAFVVRVPKAVFRMSEEQGYLAPAGREAITRASSLPLAGGGLGRRPSRVGVVDVERGPEPPCAA
jgi:hypothetical protein